MAFLYLLEIANFIVLYLIFPYVNYISAYDFQKKFMVIAAASAGEPSKRPLWHFFLLLTE